MVMQPAVDFLVSGPNPGRANIMAAAAAPSTAPCFEQSTYKSVGGCVTIRPEFVVTAMCLPTAWSLLSENF